MYGSPPLPAAPPSPTEPMKNLPSIITISSGASVPFLVSSANVPVETPSVLTQYQSNL